MDAPVTFSPAERRLVRQIARRRMFLFFFALFAVGGIGFLNDTGAKRAVEGLAVGVSILAIAVIAVGWRRRSLKDLELQHNIILILLLILAASLLVHFSFPTFVYTVLLLLNRFL